MRRRAFTAALGAAAALRPIASRGQQPVKNARVGFLGGVPNNPMIAAGEKAFSDEMRKLGWIDGQNLTIVHRYQNQPGVDLARPVAELIASNINVLAVTGPEVVVRTVASATRTIPIAMVAVNFDPIEHGLVASLARPGGNVTGIFLRQVELAQKQLELMTQALPGRIRAAVLYDALSADQFAAARQEAQRMGLQLSPLKLENPPYDFKQAFDVLAGASPQMLLVLSSPLFASSQSQIAALAIERRWPTMFIFRSYIEAGGLMSYGVDFVAMQARIADFVAKILGGAKPADIPVEQPTKFELVINAKTAKALDLTLPPSILARADEVIE
jgi:putative tryptophan/tyrosine transport system substrate-binding protein